MFRILFITIMFFFVSSSVFAQEPEKMLSGGKTAHGCFLDENHYLTALHNVQSLDKKGQKLHNRTIVSAWGHNTQVAQAYVKRECASAWFDAKNKDVRGLVCDVAVLVKPGGIVNQTPDFKSVGISKNDTYFAYYVKKIKQTGAKKDSGRIVAFTSKQEIKPKKHYQFDETGADLLLVFDRTSSSGDSGSCLRDQEGNAVAVLSSQSGVRKSDKWYGILYTAFNWDKNEWVLVSISEGRDDVLALASVDVMQK